MYTAAFAQEKTLLVFLKVGLKYSIIFCLKIYFFPLETLKGHLEVCTKKLCSLLLLPVPLPLPVPLLLPIPLPLPGLLLLPAAAPQPAVCCLSCILKLAKCSMSSE